MQDSHERYATILFGFYRGLFKNAFRTPLMFDKWSAVRDESLLIMVSHEGLSKNFSLFGKFFLFV